MVDVQASRRAFIKHTGKMVGGAGLLTTLPQSAWSLLPGIVTADTVRPKLPHGIQIGDVTAERGLIWSRADRPARMVVEYSYHDDFSRSTTVSGPYALPENDFTTRIDLTDLRADRDVFVRVSYQDLDNTRVLSAPVEGHFVTAPKHLSRSVHFLWSGDTAGQGWGINPDIGGMRIYDTMRRENPDFFIHSGDTIYADGPIEEYSAAENGALWRNLVTEEVAKVAETLNEFRGRYKYNMLDQNVLAFNAQVPQVWQWDDHEVVNNWSGSKDLSDDDRYIEKNVPLLVARGTTAFLEYAPLRPFDASEQNRVYRHIPYSDLVDLLVIDMRSYRGANSTNDQVQAGPQSRFLGEAQLTWLKQRLQHSRAVWKIIASDMPIGLIVRDTAEYFENMANGDGPPLGRELEMASLLRFIKEHDIDNVVWLTADVHYCAAHYYSPENAVFKHFKPFWEFVAGPLNAGSFGPNALDNTFGPQVVFQKAPSVPNMSPLAGFQFYGDAQIDKDSAELTISLKDIDGQAVFSQTLEPQLRGLDLSRGRSKG